MPLFRGCPPDVSASIISELQPRVYVPQDTIIEKGAWGDEFFIINEGVVLALPSDSGGTPLYLHPGYPHPDVVAAYYQDYLDDFPALATAGWGYTVECATQAIRMVRELTILESDEYLPIYDDTHHGAALVIDRMTRAFLAGVALWKTGITDPNYVDPDARPRPYDHAGARAPGRIERLAREGPTQAAGRCPYVELVARCRSSTAMVDC